MRPNDQQIIEAVTRLTCLAMFPTNPAAHKEIMRLIARMVPTVDALEWLIVTMIDRVGEWKGTAQLRGLLCTRFKPADGVEMDCGLPGFTPADSESAMIEQHESYREIKDPDHCPMHSMPAVRRKWA